MNYKIDQLFEEKLNSTLEEIKNILDEEEKKKFAEKIEKLDTTFLYDEFIEEMSNKGVEDIKENMFEDVLLQRHMDDEIVASINKKWMKAFVSSEAMYNFVLNSSNEYFKYVDELDANIRQEKINTYTAIKYLHGRALQQFLEIITLMKNGFADGAYARWRSMYEIIIIASFILEYGENVAKEFINSSDTTDHYNWAKASGVIKTKRNVTFNDIRKISSFPTDIWKEQYKLANEILHPSSQGTFNRLGNPIIEGTIPVGRTDYGFTTPGEHSAISLAQITQFLFLIFPNGDSLLYNKMIDKWIDVVRENYFRIHDEIFPEDIK